jgi:hypothetical protein
VVPVVQVDDVKIGDGRPGRHTVTLIKALSERAASHASQTSYIA